MPLYQQIVWSIRNDIDEGRYKFDEKIPTEIELSDLYSVSRITVRRAVDELCTEGYLSKKQGKGTYVHKRKIQRRLQQTDDVKSFSEVCRSSGMEPSSRMIKRELIEADKDEIQFLGLQQEDKILHIQRVQSADDCPIQLENNYYPYKQFQFLEQESLDNVSVFSLLSRKYNINVCNTSTTTIEIVLADEYQAKLLKIPFGEPLFYMNCYFIDAEGQPLFIGRQFIVGNRFTFLF